MSSYQVVFSRPSRPRRLDAARLHLLSVGTLASLMLLPTVARAQTTAIDGDFAVQRFDPAPGPRNFFVTRTARSDGNMTWSAGVFGNYANKPFVIEYCANQSCSEPSARREDVEVVQNMFTGNLLGSFTPMPKLQIGLSVPITWQKGQGVDPADGSALRGGMKATSLGDPLVEAKYRVIGDVDSPIAIGGGVFATAPVGHAMAKGKYVGDSSVTAGVRGIADVKFGPLSAAGNAVGVYRKKARVGSTEIGSELRYSVAGGYQFGPLVRAVVEGFGNSKFSSEPNGTNAFEALAGGQVTPVGPTLTISVGAGVGIIDGIGTPGLRGFFGVLYSAERTDRDGDGIFDEDDACPMDPEDKDGFEDADGCPDKDNDGDRIDDTVDKCPNQAEDMDGTDDLDGCPDLDNDHDGIPDDHDACPNKPETKNGYKDDDGCPDEVDTDNDGIPDVRDKCPNEPEDTDGFEDQDGCPDLDNDGDGIPDNADECIDQPETFNGYEDEDGCPDEDPDAPKGSKAGKKGANAAGRSAAPPAAEQTPTTDEP